jgi:hypothetical protein
VVAILLACAACSPGAERAAPSPDETETPSGTPQPSVAGSDLEDGEHYAYIKDVDAEDRTITVDVIQFLTGEEANEAYFDETGDSEGVPNDYYIKNENRRLRTLEVSDDAEIRLVWFDRDENEELNLEGQPATLEDLPGYIKGDPPRDGSPFILTVTDAVVRKIKEQYVP